MEEKISKFGPLQINLNICHPGQNRWTQSGFLETKWKECWDHEKHVHASNLLNVLHQQNFEHFKIHQKKCIYRNIYVHNKTDFTTSFGTITGYFAYLERRQIDDQIDKLNALCLDWICHIWGLALIEIACVWCISLHSRSTQNWICIYLMPFAIFEVIAGAAALLQKGRLTIEPCASNIWIMISPVWRVIWKLDSWWYPHLVVNHSLGTQLPHSLRRLFRPLVLRCQQGLGRPCCYCCHCCCYCCGKGHCRGTGGCQHTWWP